jgi:glycosyltransferase involved in cell wall biosynthesis
MKIAINTRFLLPRQLEGIGRYTYEVCKRMVEQHPEHEYLFLFDRPYNEQYIFSDRVKASVVSPPARHPLLWYLWFEWTLPRVLQQEQPDVFFSPDGYVSLRTSVPTVLTIHDLAFEQDDSGVPKLALAYYRHFTPKFCRKADHILSVSEYTKQDVVQRYGIPADKIDVCGNGCRAGFEPLDDRQRQQAREEYNNGKPYLLYIGAIHPRKNVHRLIQAFDQFKTNHPSAVSLLIAGRFAWNAGLIKSAYEQATYREDIHFLGFVPDEAINRLLGGALAFVYPSLFEGFGLPILEAMQAEVPVITSRSSSMPEVAGDAALLVDPYSIKDLAAGIQQLWASPESRQALIEAGKIQRALFSWERTAEAVYDGLLKAVER